MAPNSNLENRLCLAWRTDKPYPKRFRFSPDFSFQNSDWRLSLGFNESEEYYIQLERKSFRNDFRSFKVTTHIESVDDNKDDPVLFQTNTISQTPVCIWKAQESVVLEKMQTLKDFGEFSVICMFHWGLDNSPELKGIDHLLKDTPPDCSRHSCVGLENLSTDLNKLLLNSVFTDVKLRCEGHTFFAHKAVLSARSEVFSAMFRNKMTVTESGFVEISDVLAPVFELFLKYVYAGKIPDISNDIVSSLYSVSDKYAVNVLKIACSEQMTKCLNEENCLRFLILADAHADSAFKEKIISFISDNNRILQSEDWFKFAEEVPKLSVEVYHRCFAKNNPIESKLKTANVDTNKNPGERKLKTANVDTNKNPDKKKLKTANVDTNNKNPGERKLKSANVDTNKNSDGKKLKTANFVTNKNPGESKSKTANVEMRTETYFSDDDDDNSDVTEMMTSESSEDSDDDDDSDS